MQTIYDIDSLDNRDPEFMARVHKWICRPMARYFRSTVRGVERLPPGPGLLVGNHSGGFLTPDTFLLLGAIYETLGADAVPFGLGHEVMLRVPLVNHLVVPLGAVRASHENAHRLFEGGRRVLVYPGGDVDAMRPFRHRNRIVFGGRRGYIRLALREGVPVVPVVSAGAHATFLIVDDMKWLVSAVPFTRLLRTEVWPLTLSIPWGLTLGPVPFYVPYPTRILVEILPPVTFDRSGDEAALDEPYVKECAARVESTMQSALDRLAAERRRG